jgi:hypothetical protein
MRTTRSNRDNQDDPSEEEHVEEEDPQEEVDMADIEVEEEVPFFTCPSQAYTGLIDYRTKDGKKLYAQASAKLSDDPVSCNADEYHDLINLIKMRAEDYKWDETIMVIPKTMTAVENSEKIPLLTRHGEVTIEMIREYEDSYIHTQTRMAQDANMLFKCLFSSLSKEGRNRVQLERDAYTIVHNEKEYKSGNLLLKVMLQKMHLESQAAARGIRNELSKLSEYVPKVGFNISRFNEHVRSMMLQLEAKGEKSHDIVYNVLQAYKNVPGDDWKLYMQTLQTKVDDNPKMTLLEIMTSAEAKFKALVSDSKWNVPSEVEEKIIALEAKIRTMKKGDRIPKKGPKKKDKKEKTERKSKIPWDRTTKMPGFNLKKPVKHNNKLWYWCGKDTGGKCERYTRHKPDECLGKAFNPNKNDRRDSKKSSSKRMKSAYAKATVTQSDSEGETNADSDESMTSDGESIVTITQDLLRPH